MYRSPTRTGFCPACGGGEGALAVASLPLGANDVDLWIADADGDLSSDRTRVTVVDTAPPAAGITSPSPGTCFGPAALPVRVLDDVADACTTNLTRSYDVEGGPEYGTHGEYDVGLAVSDPSGNVVDAGRVAFTIDKQAPQPSVLVEPSAWIFPAVVPFQEFFTDASGDGSAGGGVSWDWWVTDRIGAWVRIAVNGGVVQSQEVGVGKGFFLKTEECSPDKLADAVRAPGS